jgi:uncharacterized protein YbjT (DUF2867 family)
MIRSAGDEERVATNSATPVVADFDDRPSLEAALEGVTRAYLVTPSSAAAEEQQVRFVEVAGEAGVEQIVLLSQLAADEGSPVRFLRYHAVVERRIRNWRWVTRSCALTCTCRVCSHFAIRSRTTARSSRQSVMHG